MFLWSSRGANNSQIINVGKTISFQIPRVLRVLDGKDISKVLLLCGSTVRAEEIPPMELSSVLRGR